MFLKNPAILCLNIAILIFIWARAAMSENFTIMPSLRVEERYDDNVYFRNELKRDDFVTTVSPRVEFALVNQKATLDGSYHLNARKYSENTELDYVSHIADVNATIQLTRSTAFSAGNSFIYTQDSLEIIDITLLTIRTDIYSNDAYAKIKHKHNSKTDLSLSIGNRLINYKSPLLVDSKTDTAGLSAEYGLDRNTTMTAAYEYSNYTFNLPNGDKDMDTHRATIAVSEALSRDMSVVLSAGFINMPGINGNYEWVASAGLERKLPSGAVKVTYSRDLSTPTGLTADVTVTDRLYFDWAQSITSRLDFKSFIGLSRHESAEGEVDLSSYEIGVFGILKATNRIDLGLGVVRFQQFMDDSGADLDRDQIFLNATYHAPEWRF